MKRLNQYGVVDSWLLAFILTLTLFLAAAGFGGWAFMSRSDYKNNVDQKIAAAVEVAQKETSDKKDAEFVEKEKSPVKTYVGPAAYASVSITYPKTWSAYVDETGKGGASIVDGYFHPVVIPGLQSNSNFALRMQVLSTSYASQIATYSQFLKTGKLKSVPYTPAKIPSVTGLRLEGEIAKDKQGVIILLPVRDKTLKIWTESTQFIGDLDKIVLPALTFVP